MSFGQEIAQLVLELVTTDDEFGSTIVWRHIARAENASTGAVTETPTDQTVRAGVTDPVRVRLFGDDTLAESSSAVIVPASLLSPAPLPLDRVSLDGGTTFRCVLEIKHVLGPGDGGPPVAVAYAVALGGVVEQGA